MLGREATFLFYIVQVKQGKINVIGHFEVIDWENKKDTGWELMISVFGRANDFGLIKNHAILKKYDST